MNSTPEEVKQQVEQLFKQKSYQEIIELLNDELLANYNYAPLYYWRARVHGSLNELESSLFYAQKSIDTDPSMAMGYLARGNTWFNKKEYDKAISDYTEAIKLDQKLTQAYYNRGTTWYLKNDYKKAITGCTEAIELGQGDSAIYIHRGNAWYYEKEYDRAISDYTEAIKLDKNSSGAHMNRGIAWELKKEYDKAIADYNEAIRIDQNFAVAYYNRGDSLSEKKEYDKAIKDYEHYVELIKDNDIYDRQVALDKITELKKKIANAWYDEVDNIVDKIKQLLLFDSPCLTHYTSLSGAKAMVLSSSPFRLSEGAFLNDTSEGRELFNYLSFKTTTNSVDETIAELFVERPFIGSFVAENKHNDLTLWRMYGKEAQAEAKGCALTINKANFIDNLKNKLRPSTEGTDIQSQTDEQFTFYNVAYLSKEKFTISGKSNLDENKLNTLMSELKNKVRKLNKKQKTIIKKLLNGIAYLFKSAEYQYENEVRLVVQGIGFVKIIDKESSPPKVYIELTDIVPALNKITLGPKVERADEWAAAFNYQIKEQFKARKDKVEIIISHLPFK